MPIVAYISHPIGDDDDSGRRQDNIANAGAWSKFLLDVTPWIIWAPWYLYAIVHPNDVHAPRRLIDSMATIERSDILVQVGGYLSPHMIQQDARTARRVGVPVLDLTAPPFGITPPDRHDEAVVQILLSRTRKIIALQPRRVWMPLLTAEQLDQLKRLRHSVYVAMSDDHEYEIALLDRIISAASERGD